MPDPTKDFLGAGWKFPVRLDARGRLELVQQEADVEEAIRMILLTHRGERMMRPEFGSELFRLQFLPLDAGHGRAGAALCAGGPGALGASNRGAECPGWPGPKASIAAADPDRVPGSGHQC